MSLSILEEKAKKTKAKAEAKEKRKTEMEEKRRRKEVLKMKREDEKAAKANKRETEPDAKPQKSSARNKCEKTIIDRSKLPSSGRKGKEKASTSRDFDVNQCAICFQSFFEDDEGEEWIECVCGRWVHENCIEYDIVVDTHGRERLCPSCVM